MSLFSDFLDLFFPKMCVACEKRLIENENYLCLTCLLDIPKTNYHKMKGNKLEEFFAGRFPFDQISSYAFYTKSGIIQSMIHELKYNNNPDIGIFMGKLCGIEIKDSSFIKSIDCLVPVPLHPQRKKKRGYNQSEKIAEGISSEIGISVNSDNLIRLINNPSQTTQSKYERWINTEGIFGLRDSRLFEGKHILLIDDIITTGSTIESCAKTIIKNSPDSKISIFSVGATV